MISEFILTLGRVFWSSLRARTVRIEKAVEPAHTPQPNFLTELLIMPMFKVATRNTHINEDGIAAILWIMSDLDSDLMGDL